MTDFGKFLTTNLLTKVAQKMIGTFWAIKKINLCKNCGGYYLGNFWKHLGNFFTPSPGHAGTRTLFLKTEKISPNRADCFLTSSACRRSSSRSRSSPFVYTSLASSGAWQEVRRTDCGVRCPSPSATPSGARRGSRRWPTPSRPLPPTSFPEIFRTKHLQRRKNVKLAKK